MVEKYAPTSGPSCKISSAILKGRRVGTNLDSSPAQLVFLSHQTMAANYPACITLQAWRASIHPTTLQLYSRLSVTKPKQCQQQQPESDSI